MSVTRHFVLAAGGTGGHMIPAHAVAEELMARGHHVALVTDERGAKIPGIFDKAAVHVLPAGRMQGGPLGWLRGLKGIREGRDMARRMYANFRPTVVCGFGGYPALPALLAALKDDVPTVIHEQNAVMGRANKMLASRVQSGQPTAGLLYELTTVISDLNLNIASAHIATFGEKAVDVFYVADLTGEKIANPAREGAIRRRLVEILGGPAAARAEGRPETRGKRGAA